MICLYDTAIVRALAMCVILGGSGWFLVGGVYNMYGVPPRETNQKETRSKQLYGAKVQLYKVSIPSPKNPMFNKP